MPRDRPDPKFESTLTVALPNPKCKVAHRYGTFGTRASPPSGAHADAPKSCHPGRRVQGRPARSRLRGLRHVHVRKVLLARDLEPLLVGQVEQADEVVRDRDVGQLLLGHLLRQPRDHLVKVRVRVRARVRVRVRVRVRRATTCWKETAPLTRSPELPPSESRSHRLLLSPLMSTCLATLA